jgi:hypothetical protein
MKKHWLSLAISAVFLIGGTTLIWAQAANRKPYRLTSRQLDYITAGHTDSSGSSPQSGGVIVASGSQATITNEGSVSLSGGSQQGAKGLNIVDSVGSQVANGVNVWDGQVNDQTTDTTFTVNQKNSILQNQVQAATLQGYTQGKTLYRSAYASDQTSESAAYTLQTSTSVDAKPTDAPLLQIGDVVTLRNPTTDATQALGLAAAGKLNVSVDAGQFGLNFSQSASFDSKLSKVIETSLSNNVSIGVNWVLPKINIQGDGSGCFTMGGSCMAASNESSMASSTENKLKTATYHSSGPLSIDKAQAQEIAVGDSTLSAASTYSVLLGDNAQQNVSALNLVNAANSLIANAVNVSRTPSGVPVLNLNQTNVIVQNH